MARYEIVDANLVAMGAQNADGDVFFQLGMMYSTGRSVDVDLIEAHKWFNLATFKGNGKATQYREEIANEMSRIEIASAQREAREWLRVH